MAKKNKVKKERKPRQDFAEKFAQKLRETGLGEVDEGALGDDSGRWVKLRVKDTELCFSFDMNEGNVSTVRTNLMNEEGYTGYCGNSWAEQKKKGCDMPRTKWVAELNQFRCPKCGWVSQFPVDFIARYKERWGK